MKGRTYRYMSAEPLYPFGFGLSYTSFSYSGLTLSKESIGKKDTVKAVVTVTNTGKMAGDEVVQLYMTHENMGGDAPLFALKAFQRVSLAAGASAKLVFVLGPDKLSVVDEKGLSVVPEGKIKISIGGSLPGRRSEELGAAKGVETQLEIK
jgi:beta-glucosidase